MNDNNTKLPQGWHVDKTVSVSHIITTISMLIAGLWFLAQLNERISLNTQAISQNKSQIEAQDSRVSRNLEAINEKLDKIQELMIRNAQK